MAHKTKAKDGKSNLCGGNVAKLRCSKGLSQRELSDCFLEHGLDMNKNQVQRMEAGKRVVADTELPIIADVLGVGVDSLLRDDSDIFDDKHKKG